MAIKEELLVSDEIKRLRLFRKGEGHSQETFASALGISRLKIQRYEAGTYMIPLELIRKMHEVFHMSYEWFFHGTGHKKSVELKSGLIKDIKTLESNQHLLEGQVSLLKKQLFKVFEEIQHLKSS
ncbi:helix-turn-helix domain-containing protein [Pedobacter sp. MR2016-24]|uniref:helix-turn-helix domain-containing protein n=1 Tax=Pedobacter sp. MR2016-24 TaxID=2994466 RepID=UPI00224717A8|nr:helix-turn-helix transcriptional regulator [Pedobacter sp. MR2016-24]MCX2484511.1 helix-turn-helix transcriptional regulator [Pedobacter sp. MR2016-24]